MQIHHRKELVEEINRIFHDLTAESYDRMHPEIFKVQHSRLIEFLRTHLDGHFPVILDAGSGDGFMLSVIKTAGTPTYDRFLMLDISVNMLRIAEERHPEAITVNASLMSIPLRDESVNLITANSVLHHLPEPEKFLREARRILKSGGILLINHEPNLRFSRNGVLWYLSSTTSRIIRNAITVRSLRRVIASIRGIRNPAYSRINSILMP